MERIERDLDTGLVLRARVVGGMLACGMLLVRSNALSVCLPFRIPRGLKFKTGNGIVRIEGNFISFLLPFPPR